MRKLIFIVLLLVAAMAAGCSENTSQTESRQQETGISALLANQPVPDLGGYSFERQIMIDLEVRRNKGNVSTYAYTMTFDGKIIEICASRGFPIPYATQLTNPTRVSSGGGLPGTGAGNTSIGNPEPNGLYPPASTAGTWIACINSDGSVTPEYWEQDVFSLPYRIKSDIQIQRLDSATPEFTVKTK